MKRYLLAALAVIILLYPATASAAPIKECGTASEAVNVTARKFTCSEARAIARNYIAAGGRPHMLYQTKRNHRNYVDVRLWDRYGYVVRFQWGC
jgi:hypothetical protein